MRSAREEQGRPHEGDGTQTEFSEMCRCALGRPGIPEQNRGQREDKAGPVEHIQGERPGARMVRVQRFLRGPSGRLHLCSKEHSLSVGWGALGGLNWVVKGSHSGWLQLRMKEEAGREPAGYCKRKGMNYALGVG